MRDTTNERGPFTMGPISGTAGPPNQNKRRFVAPSARRPGDRGKGNFNPNVVLDTSQVELGKTTKSDKQSAAISRRLEMLDKSRGR